MFGQKRKKGVELGATGSVALFEFLVTQVTEVFTGTPVRLGKRTIKSEEYQNDDERYKVIEIQSGSEIIFENPQIGYCLVHSLNASAMLKYNGSDWEPHSGFCVDIDGTRLTAEWPRYFASDFVSRVVVHSHNLKKIVIGKKLSDREEQQ